MKTSSTQFVHSQRTIQLPQPPRNYEKLPSEKQKRMMRQRRRRHWERTEGGAVLQKDKGVLCGNVQIGLHKGLPWTTEFYKGNNMANKNSQVEDVREILTGV